MVIQLLSVVFCNKKCIKSTRVRLHTQSPLVSAYGCEGVASVNCIFFYIEVLLLNVLKLNFLPPEIGIILEYGS